VWSWSLVLGVRSRRPGVAARCGLGVGARGAAAGCRRLGVAARCGRGVGVRRAAAGCRRPWAVGACRVSRVGRRCALAGCRGPGPAGAPRAPGAHCALAGCRRVGPAGAPRASGARLAAETALRPASVVRRPPRARRASPAVGRCRLPVETHAGDVAARHAAVAARRRDGAHAHGETGHARENSCGTRFGLAFGPLEPW
jgi:hypothetical protein